MKRRLLATLLSLVMIVGLLPTSVFAENGECDGQNCTHEAAIGSRHYDTLSEALTAVSGETTVALINNITLSEDITLNTNLQIPAGVNVTIDGGGRKITAGENYGGGFFTVNAGATLDLVNVTLDGGVAYKLKIDKDEFDYTLVYGQSDLLEDPAWERTEPLIKVDNATLNLNDKTKILNVFGLWGESGNTGNVSVINATQSNLNLNDVEITHCFGEIIVAHSSHVKLYKVNVHDNFLSSHEGSFLHLTCIKNTTLASTLEINEGTVIENNIVEGRNAIFGLAAYSATTMNAGIMRYNMTLKRGSAAGSVFHLRDGADFTMIGGEICYNQGILASAVAIRWPQGGGDKEVEIVLSGGKIYDNTTILDGWYNAAVFLRDDKTTINSGMTIDGNVVLADGATDFTNNGEINGNVILNHVDSSNAWANAWDDDPNTSYGKIPGTDTTTGTGTLDGYVLDTYGNKALANDTFIQGSGAITLNEDGTLNIPADSDITIHGDSKVHSTTAVTVDKDGNVVIKTGETVTVENENGSETIITGPAIIDKDGDVTVSPGGSVGSLIVPNDDELKIPLNEIGDITTDTENGGVDMPKDTVVTIHETVITGKVQLNTDGSATINEPTTTVVVAGKITITGGPSKVAADGTVTVEADKDTTITLKNGVTIKGPATVDRDGASVEVGTGSSIKNGDTDVVVTNGKATVNADGSVVVPAGSVVTVNGVTITGEATISADGKIVSVETDGKIKIEDKEYTVETGKVDVKVEDSSMEIPAGSTVKIGDVTITGPASIDANGVVTVQTGGKIKVGEKEYEVILGTVTLEDEQLVIPENSKVRDEKGGVIAGPRTVNPSDTGNQEYSAGSSLQVGDKTVTVEDGSVTVGTDGTINVPEGTTVKVGDKTITGPASISPDGETTVTTGGSVTAGDTTVTVKDGEVTVEGDGSIKIPSGTTVEVKVTDEDGNVVSTTVTGPGSVSADGETVTVEPTGVIDGVGPDGATVQVTVPEGTEITVPVDQADQVTTNENDDIVVPVGAVITKGDVAVEVKNGEVTIDSENGNVTVADDAVVEINGVKITGPATVDKDGNVTVQADGKINDYVVPEGDITIPGGDMDEVSGSEEEVSLPAGSIVTGEVSVEVVTGSVTVDDEGNITVPDESVIKIGDTTITGPASVDKDGNVKVEEEGKINGVVVPNGTTIVVPADDLDDVTTTDDKITVPADSTVTTGDTKVEVESGEVTVGGDGSIAVPTGSTIKVGDTTITGPATVDKDGNVTVDAGGKIDNGDDSYTVPADTKVTVPADKLDDVIKDTEGNTVIPEGSTITTGGVDVEVEKGNVTVDDEGNITVPDDSTIKVGDTTITGPATVDKDGNVTVDAGGKIDNGNGDSYTVPDGTTITIPGGKLDEVTTDENGTTFPEGTKIDMGGDPKVVVTGPATIDKDGNVNVEQGGKITVGEGENQKEYTVEEGTVTVTKDDEVKIDSGAKVEDEEGVVITGPADLNDNGKTAAKAAIDAAVNDAKAKIDSNTELSDEAKEILKDSIDEAVAEAEKAITNATTTEQVEKAKDDCIEAIEALGNASHSHMEGDDIFTLFSGELKGDVYLLRDEVLTDDVTISEDVCLCLSGKTFNLAGHTITVAAGATLTICDCQSTLTHGIVNDGLWSPHANGAVTLTGGVIFGGSMEVEGELAVTGGNLAGLRGGVKLSNGGKLTVSGGKLCHNVK